MENSNKDLATIVTVTYNVEDLLAETILSAAQPNYIQHIKL